MCKCEKTSNFKTALRSALAQTTDKVKFAVWENNGEVYTGTVEQAEKRLQSGQIECYFLPKTREGDEVSFSIVDEVKASKTSKTATVEGVKTEK